MRRKITIISLLLSISLGILFWPEVETVETDSVATSKDPLIKIYRESGAEFNKLQIEGWVLVNNNYETVENLNKMIATIDAETDVSLARMKRAVYDEERVRSISIEGNDLGYYANLNVQTVRGVEGTEVEPETYVVFTLETETIDLAHNNTFEQVKKALEKLAPNPQVSTVITAKSTEQLDEPEREDRLIQMVTAAEAQKYDLISTENLTSLTGYSSQIKNKVTVAGQKVNVNLAIRYNHLEEVSYFYIGTPIISTEY